MTLFGFDQIVSTLALYLAVTGASGQAVSLDRFLARVAAGAAPTGRGGAATAAGSCPPGVPAPTVSANLALRLIQLHLVLIYGMAGLAKLQGPAWWTGMAIWGTLASGEFRLLDFTWLAAWPYAPERHDPRRPGAGADAIRVLIWVRMLRPLVIAAAGGAAPRDRLTRRA